jgi:SAM-dependent methyltransferase
LQPDPKCPVCDARHWQLIGERKYDQSDKAVLDEYTARRYRVLFELWFPRTDTVTLKAELCRTCGFVIYVPRPTETDLTAKYRFLNETGADYGRIPAESPRELRRANDLWRRLRRHTTGRTRRVLDFGGGDGRLMVPFVRRGHECHLVDYHPEAVPGVTRIASTLEDVSSADPYDVIICSHVLEHVAEPRPILSRLAALLDERGVLYVEVPMEIWRRPPLQREPVTHINFFTVDSLRALIERSGLRVARCRMGSYRHPAGHRATVIRAIARRAAPFAWVPDPNAASRTRNLLAPGVVMRLRMAAIRPDMIWRKLWSTLAPTPGRQMERTLD